MCHLLPLLSENSIIGMATIALENIRSDTEGAIVEIIGRYESGEIE